MIAVSMRDAVLLCQTSPAAGVSDVMYLGGDYFTSVSFSHDSKWLAAGDSQGQIHVWDLQADSIANSEMILDGHEGWITSVAFDSTQFRLATTSRDGTARLWEMRTDRLKEIAIGTAGRQLRGDEYQSEALQTLSSSANRE